MDVESRKKVQKVVKLREVVTQMKYARVENIALCCALEINTWWIFVFFWGKHDGNKNRASKEDLRHYTGREHVEAIFFISHVEIPYRRAWKNYRCV